MNTKARSPPYASPASPGSGGKACHPLTKWMGVTCGLFFIKVAACNSKIPLCFALARSCAHTALNTLLA